MEKLTVAGVSFTADEVVSVTLERDGKQIVVSSAKKKVKHSAGFISAVGEVVEDGATDEGCEDE